MVVCRSELMPATTTTICGYNLFIWIWDIASGKFLHFLASASRSVKNKTSLCCWQIQTRVLLLRSYFTLTCGVIGQHSCCWTSLQVSVFDHLSFAMWVCTLPSCDFKKHKLFFKSYRLLCFTSKIKSCFSSFFPFCKECGLLMTPSISYDF